MRDRAERYLLESGNAVQRLAPISLAVGTIALLACAVSAVGDPTTAAQSYLVAFLFWSGLALGSLAVLMLQHITGGAWGAIIRRILESASATMPLLLVLFVPILLSVGSLYEWAHPEVVARDALLQHKRAYLNVPFFAARAVGYFAVWITLAHFLKRWSRQQDSGVPSVLRLENLSRGGLLLFALTMTFASIDWAMSLEPHWYSTMYGILFIGGQILSALAFAIPVAATLASQDSIGETMTPDRFQDLGKLLLAFVMLWAYVSFSQFLIIWSADLPEETPWYLRRLTAGWLWLAIGLVVFHFALPFALLLSRGLKRHRRWLMAVALIILLMRAADLSWLILPAFDRHGEVLVLSDLTAFLGIGGVWFFAFVRELRAGPVLPLNDAALPEVPGAHS